MAAGFASGRSADVLGRAEPLISRALSMSRTSTPRAATSGRSRAERGCRGSRDESPMCVTHVE